MKHHFKKRRFVKYYMRRLRRNRLINPPAKSHTGNGLNLLNESYDSLITTSWKLSAPFILKMMRLVKRVIGGKHLRPF